MDKNQWISDKISTLVQEGKPQQQAVAIAEAMWEQQQREAQKSDPDATKRQMSAAERAKVPAEDFVDAEHHAFPIVTPEDVRAAVSSFGRGQMPYDAFRARLTAIAHRKGDAFVAALPQDWKDTAQKAVEPDAIKAVHFGSEVKLAADGSTVEGYLVQFGTPDEADFDNEYFDATTDFDVDWNTGGKATVYFNHGLDPVIGKAKLGGGMKAELTLKDQGVWIEARLKEGSTYDEMVKQLMQKRRTGWSSGVPAHLVTRERTGKAYHIKTWPLGADASITHMPNDWRNIATLKSLAQELSQAALEDGADAERTARRTEGSHDGSGGDPLNEAAAVKTYGESEPPIMDETQIKQMAALVAAEVTATLKAQLNAEDAQALEAKAADELKKQMANCPPDEEDAQQHMMKAVTSAEFTEFVAKTAQELQSLREGAVAAAVKAHLAKREPQSQVPGHQQAAPLNIPMRSKFADLSASDMAFLHHMRKAAANARNVTYVADNLFMREMLDKAQKSYVKGDLRLADDSPTVKAITGLKSNELDTSTQAGYGDEWVPDLHSADLWERTRIDNVVAPRIRFIEMPSNPFELPVQTTDPTVYKVAETVNEASLTLADTNSPIPDSKVATTKVTLTAAKLGLRTMWSAEAEEDSIIPFVANARAQSMRAMQDAIDNVFLNGDTATTLNVNSDGESISDTTRKYLVFNGMIKSPLVTTTTYSKDASGASPTLALLRATRALLPNYYGTDIRNLMWIVDYSTYMKMLGIDEISSAANRGSAPTGVTGVLNGIDGVDLFVSNEMALADTDGKVTQTSNTTNTGRALLVHRPSWVGGYRRRIASSMTYHAEYDSYILVSTVRIALVQRDTAAAAILFNIGI